MKKFLPTFILFLLPLFGFDIDIHHPLYETGTTGAFIGATDDVVIIAGGVRDELTQDEIIVLEKTKYGSVNKYTREGMSLPFPIAHGASVSMKDGLLCLGGLNESKCFTEALLLKWNKDKKNIEFITMPPLPFPLAYASAARIGKKIFLVGGVSDNQCQKPNRYLLELNLEAITNPSWIIRCGLLGEPRINPAMTAQSNGLRDALYIFGGQNPITKEALSDAYTYDPQLDQWDDFGPIPSPSQNLFAATSGANHIYVNGEAFYTYHTITHMWTKIAEPKMAELKGRPLINQKENTYFGPSDKNSAVFIHTAKHNYSFGKLNTSIILTYLFIMIGIALYFSFRKKQTSLEYFKGNLSIPWWAAGLSILGTEVSTLNFLSVPAKAFASDWQYLVMDMTLILVIPLIVYGFLPLYRRLQVTTTYEYLENRFSLSVRLITSSVYIVFELLRIGIVLYLPAIALSFITGWSIPFCIISMGSLSVLYTALGGIEAVIWTDVVQVVIFVLAAVLGICFILYDCHMSLSEIYTLAFDHEKMKIFDFDFDLRRPTFWVIFFSSISYDIMDNGVDQSTVQRYLTVKNNHEAKKSIWLNVVLCFLLGLLFYALGTILYVFFRKNPEMMDSGMQLADNLFAHYIVSRLPAGVSGILITGLFAAAMSTLDSSINAISTTITNDFITRLGKRKSDSSTVRIAKWTTFIVGALGTGYSLFLTRFKIISFLDYYDVVLAYTLCSISGIFLLGIFTKRANSKGVLWGLAISTITLFLYHKYVNTHFLMLMSISTISTFLFGYLASLLHPEKKRETDGYTVYAPKNVYDEV